MQAIVDWRLFSPKSRVDESYSLHMPVVKVTEKYTLYNVKPLLPSMDLVVLLLCPFVFESHQSIPELSGAAQEDSDARSL